MLDVDFYWERDWVEVRADEVLPDDLYANHATVTESRPWTEADGRTPGSGVRCEWIIQVGEGFSTTGPAERRVVVGRNPRKVVIEDGYETEGPF